MAADRASRLPRSPLTAAAMQPTGMWIAVVVTVFAGGSALASIVGIATRDRRYALGGFVTSLLVPLVGLASTAGLLVVAFRSLEGVPASEKSAHLSAHIASAMQPTFWALLSTVPCLALGVVALVVVARAREAPRAGFGVHPRP